MTIYIKDMVCRRCKMAVRSVLENLGINYISIELGRVKLTGKLTSEEQNNLDKELKYYGLVLMEDKKQILTERIKTIIIEAINSPIDHRLKFSEYLHQILKLEYNYLSNVFSDTEGYTIEKFYITTKIEKVKELILYQEWSITEIAYQLQYSNVSYLCLQFKKVTGMTPVMFKKLCKKDDYVWREV